MSLRGWVLVCALACAACLPSGFGITITEPPEPPPEPPVPERFTGEVAPALVASPVAGFKAAPSLNPRVYFGGKDEQWYRYAYNRWYTAFAWNGNWFPLALEEVPDPLGAITSEMRKQSAVENQGIEKTREQKLKELDEKLRALEKQ
ncbi:MAG: hypothetical protein GY725_01485 [bacterium]|nr:hypothetical protein [bacterium]